MVNLLHIHNLFLKPEKCKFERTEIEYLGVIISHNSVRMDPIKIAGVSEWPIPSNKKEVQSFLGFTNFYRRFIQDFSYHARPLFDLTKKDAIWKWDSDKQAAFTILKDKITSAPVLLLPENSHPFCIVRTLLPEPYFLKNLQKMTNGIL